MDELGDMSGGIIEGQLNEGSNQHQSMLANNRKDITVQLLWRDLKCFHDIAKDD